MSIIIPGGNVFDTSGISLTPNVQKFIAAGDFYSSQDTQVTASDLQYAADYTQEQANNTNAAEFRWNNAGDPNPDAPPGAKGVGLYDCYIWELENQTDGAGNKFGDNDATMVTQLYTNANAELSAKNTQINANSTKMSSVATTLQGAPQQETAMVQNVLSVMDAVIGDLSKV